MLLFCNISHLVKLLIVELKPGTGQGVVESTYECFSLIWGNLVSRNCKISPYHVISRHMSLCLEAK